ncbi:MAG: hydantoinase/oxoprolinase family protein, partial [Clostridiales bacterium]|nr:hydantoinase/oxoprolinase family protein [Clostridiales bacterium]
RRTRTAAINGSILPKMLSTATSTEQSVRSAGIDVPLMIMRGDGGVMDILEMKKRPVLTMLSGPAASVMGALMYLRASNGIYFEVGGTSTNIGVIKNGRPAVEYTIIGGHKTYVNSLDVRVLGVAGGSMIRASNNKLVDVGPRSAHIAGLKYSAYTPTEEIQDPKIEFFSPRKGDPADYVRIRLKNGECITLTNSCAANVLGLCRPEDYSFGIVESARKCMAVLAEYLQISIEEAAMQIMEKSYGKIMPVLDELMAKYRLERDQTTLVGVGGGAASLIPYSAKKLSIGYSIPKYAEIISSIGVALAMVRDVVERIIPNPTTEDITRIKREAKALAIKNGALPDSVEVQIEIDAQTSRVSAIALGSTEVQSMDLRLRCSEEDAHVISAESMRADPSEVYLIEKSDIFYVFGRKNADKQQIRLVDIRGFVKVQCADGEVAACQVKDWEAVVERLWEAKLGYERQMVQTPDIYLAIGGKLLDYSNTLGLEQLRIIMRSEFLDAEPEEDIILISARREVI